MLSRVADSLYWMSRYMERNDGILRMLKINYASSQDDVQESSWMPVLSIYTYLSVEEAEKIAHDSRAVIQFMVTDRDNPNSVVNMVTLARENARAVQDHITVEVWRCINEFYHAVRDERLIEWLANDDPVTVLDDLIRRGLQYYGTADITMSRGAGHSFINIGKYLERGIQSVDILDVKLNSKDFSIESNDTIYWKYMLMSISGYELYLKTYRKGFEARNVIEQVVLNNDFPRSVLHSLHKVYQYLNRVENQQTPESYKQLEMLIGKLRSKVQYSTVDDIMEQGLARYLHSVKADMYTIAHALDQNCFAHS
jgi:uncharacterized alpha-E superfamily protein